MPVIAMPPAFTTKDLVGVFPSESSVNLTLGATETNRITPFPSTVMVPLSTQLPVVIFVSDAKLAIKCIPTLD
jgi:hypothetical protein